MIGSLAIAQSKFDRIQADLREHYSSLHIFPNRNGATEVAGRFPVMDSEGKALDYYAVSIILPSAYPEDLPVVYEVGGRIPRVPDRHIYTNGSACVFMPDDRWRSFPLDSSFIDYLNGPLHNYFLSQLTYEKTGEWPFGEFSHDEAGIIEYYQELFETQDISTVIELLLTLCDDKLRKHNACPCGSGKKVKRCCLLKIRDIRKKISPKTAASALRRIFTRHLLYREAARHRMLMLRSAQLSYPSKSS